MVSQKRAETLRVSHEDISQRRKIFAMSKMHEELLCGSLVSAHTEIPQPDGPVIRSGNNDEVVELQARDTISVVSQR